MLVDSTAKPEPFSAEMPPDDDASPPVHETEPPKPVDDHTFQLCDLRVEVVCPPGKRILCGAKPGDHFTLEGELLKLPPGQGFSIYSLGAVLPLLAAKQRVTSPYDWMATDAEVACPDPHCPSKLRIVRTSVRTFRREDTTVVPLPGPPSKSTPAPLRTVPAPTPSHNERPRSQPDASPRVFASMETAVEPPATPTPQPAGTRSTDADADPEDDPPAEFSDPCVLDYLRADWG